MRNLIIGGVPNYVDEALLAAGSQASQLPVTNLKDRQLVRVWRSSELGSSETWIEARFEAVRNIGLVAVIGHNFTQSAQWRVRLAQNPAFAPVEYDSGYMDVWPQIEEFGSLPWGVFQWGGVLPGAVAVEFTLHAIVILPQAVLATYLRVDIADSSNPAGYVQAGRLIAGPVYEPSVNMEYGWTIGYEDNSEFSKSRGGQTWSDPKPRYRVLTFTLSDLPEDEVFSNIFYHVFRRKGTVGDMLFIPQPENIKQMHNQAIYGRLRRLNPVQNPYFGAWATSFEVEELI